MSYGCGKILESILLYTKSKLLSHKYSVILFIFKKTNQYTKFFMNAYKSIKSDVERYAHIHSSRCIWGKVEWAVFGGEITENIKYL